MKVHAMMSSLTTRQREIVYYRYIKDMSIDEISKITDMNYQSVSNSIQRALGRAFKSIQARIGEKNIQLFLPIKKISKIV